MLNSNFVLAVSVVALLSGCSSFSLSKRTDGVSSSDGTVRVARSTKHTSKTPRDVMATPDDKGKNAPKATALVAKSAKSSPAPASAPAPDAADTEIRDVVASVGAGESTAHSYANEDVASLNTGKVMRQPVIDLDQLSAAPLTKHAAPLIPDRPRVYAFGPTKPGSTLADVADQLLPTSRVTVAQMMWALYRKNPEAFTNKNINTLKARSLLNVPELDELLSISRAEAETQINRLGGSIKTKISAAY